MKRCHWVDLDKPLYIEYHDKEWGVPVKDDQRLFEMLILEGAQAGLSWWTVLNKREGYRKAFKNFNVVECSELTEEYLESQRENPEIIRNKLKIYSVRRNAQVFIQLQQEFGSFSSYLWDYVDNKQKKNIISPKKYIVTSEVSDAISKDLKKRGMKFVGSIIIYAYMQAVGMVDDHESTCFKRS